MSKKKERKSVQAAATRPKSVDAMSHEQLKEYAGEIGIQQRDIDGLTEDRLRQNCKVRVFTSLEDE